MWRHTACVRVPLHVVGLHHMWMGCHQPIWWPLANPTGSTTCGWMATCQSDGHLPVCRVPLHVDSLRQCVAFHNMGCGWMVTCQSWEHLHSLLAAQKSPNDNASCSTTCGIPPHVAGCLHCMWCPRNNICCVICLSLHSETFSVMTKGCSPVWGPAPSIHIPDVAPDRLGFIAPLRRNAPSWWFVSQPHRLNRWV